jgi:hypothetical protein
MNLKISHKIDELSDPIGEGGCRDRCEFESRCNPSCNQIQHYVIIFVSDLR